MTASEIISYMESLRNQEQRQILMRFFKTGRGEYGEGDEFLGLKVPQTRQVVKLVANDTPLDEALKLLESPWHEVRLCGLLLMVGRFERLSTKKLIDDEGAILRRDELVRLYLDHAERANNWDLVDLSAPKILGHWLTLPTHLEGGKGPSLARSFKRSMLDALATSPNLWRQRISMVCTMYPSHEGDPAWCQRYAAMHLAHPHDLMHKAVGWMLREMGKHCGMDVLREFLQLHVGEMHRTTLRYAIERMSEGERQEWMLR